MPRSASPSLGLLLAALALGPPPAGAARGSVTAADGVPIVYDDAGAGEPALVFVHCWSCERGFWSATVERFSPEHRVVALDLAGHGESGRGRRDWTIAGLAADVRTVVEALGLERVVLVGHSLGGPVVLEAARLLPGRVAGIVPVDTLHDVDGAGDPAAERAWWSKLIAAHEKDFAGACRGFVATMFPSGAETAVVERARATMCAAAPEVAVPLLRAAAAHDAAPAWAAAGVPVRAIQSARYATDVQGNRRLHPDYAALVMDGVGHFPHLERPEEFHHRLAAVLAELAGGPPAASTPAAARLADLAWLAGGWRHADDTSLSEEVWSAPHGDSMQGMWRQVRGGRTAVFEGLAVVREPEAPVLFLRHFRRDFVGWEEKDAPLRLPLVRWSPGEAAFEGKGSDGAPLRITYRKAGEDALESTMEHGPRRLDFRFERAR
jgi:pimeloyl-ACP methyl ester carboxylesterase